MPSLTVLIKPSSGMCNMRCDYCFYRDEAENRSRENYGFMTEDTLRNIIRRTLSRADRTVTYAFQGGEPTLRGLVFSAGRSDCRSSTTGTASGYRTLSRPTARFWTMSGAVFLQRTGSS